MGRVGKEACVDACPLDKAYKVHRQCIYASALSTLMQRRPADVIGVPSARAAQAPPSPGRHPWRAARLLDSPHGLCFFWAGVSWAVSAAWWAAQLCAIAIGFHWPTSVPLTSAHGLLFTMAAMPLFIAGFVFTAGPKWLKRPPVSARRLRWPVWLYATGWALAVAGFHLDAALAAFGLAVASGAWGALTLLVFRLVAGSPTRDRVHASGIALACLGMLGCLAASSLALWSTHPEWLRMTLRIGLWSVVAVFLLVSHRMLPFLGARAFPRLDARWPHWPLGLVLSVPLVEGAAAILDLSHTSSGVRTAVAAVTLAMAATVCLLLALHFRREAALRQPLVAMLYIAFLWWDVSLWLGAASWLPWESGSTRASLDMARMHTLALGFLGGTLLLMATRISSTHSGRPQAIDLFARLLYGALQAAIVMRLASALWAQSSALLLPLAACTWMGIAGFWAARHGRWMGGSRANA